MPARVLLIRHGQSTWNAARRWQGQADPPLTELGERQASEAGSRLGLFDLVVASDLERARRTAEVIADELGIGPVELDPQLRENRAGEWEGLTARQVERDWPGYLATHRRPPGFEPAEDVAARAIASLLTIARRAADGEILAVSHGGVIRVLRRLLGAQDGQIPNLSGCWFTVHERDLDVDDEIVALIEPSDSTAPGPAQAAESETLADMAGANDDAERL
jgi:probable phosphoglycerate mutase